MLKKILNTAGLPVLALAGVMMFAGAPKADAAVHFGVYWGAPYYNTYPYPYPYAYSYPYDYYPYGYGYYSYPDYGGGYYGYWGGHYDRDWNHHDHDRGWGHYGHDRGFHGGERGGFHGGGHGHRR